MPTGASMTKAMYLMARKQILARVSNWVFKAKAYQVHFKGIIAKVQCQSSNIKGKDIKDKKKQKQSKTDKKRKKTKTRVKNEEIKSRISPTQQERKSKAKIIKPRTKSDKCSKFKGLF
ncbi:hypothetical protein Tco_1285740 [Tanacetum coccineum]